jgi:hypothetical protein
VPRTIRRCKAVNSEVSECDVNGVNLNFTFIDNVVCSMMYSITGRKNFSEAEVNAILERNGVDLSQTRAMTKAEESQYATGLLLDQWQCWIDVKNHILISKLYRNDRLVGILTLTTIHGHEVIMERYSQFLAKEAAAKAAAEQSTKGL